MFKLCVSLAHSQRNARINFYYLMHGCMSKWKRIKYEQHGHIRECELSYLSDISFLPSMKHFAYEKFPQTQTGARHILLCVFHTRC